MYLNEFDPFPASPGALTACDSHPRGQPLGRQVIGSHAGTEKPGALNPEFCRWLMGFPAGWGLYADTATRLSRK